MRGLEKIFSPVVVYAMSDTEVEAIASEPLSAKHQRDLLENGINRRRVACLFARSFASWGGKQVLGFGVPVFGYSSFLGALYLL